LPTTGFGNTDLAGATTLDTSTEESIVRESEYLFKIDVPDEPFEDQNQVLIEGLEVGVRELLVGISKRMNDGGEYVIRSAKLNPEAHSRLVQGLPWPGLTLTFDWNPGWDQIRESFDWDHPFIGQSVDNINLPLGQTILAPQKFSDLSARAMRRELAGLPNRSQGIPIVSYELLSVRFEAGSAFGIPKIRQKFLVGLFSILGTAGAAVGAEKAWDWFSGERDLQHSYEVAAQGPAVKFCGEFCSLDELRHLQEKSFNYNERGISAAERERRIAAEQIVLNMALHMDLVVDGKLGPETFQAERDFGTEFNVPGTNSSRYFRTKLPPQVVPPRSAKK
jgi:hypothetical protein